MDRIKEMLDRLSELSEEELTELEGLIVTEFKTVEKADATPQSVDMMTELADAVDTVRSEKTTRQQQAAELSRRKDEAAARINGPADVAEEDSTENEPAAPAAEEDKEEQPVAVAASTDTPAEAETSQTNPTTELATEEPAPAPAAAAELSTSAPEQGPTNEPSGPENVPDTPTPPTTPENEPSGPENVPDNASSQTAEGSTAGTAAPDEANTAQEAVTAASDTGKDPEAPVTAAAETPQDLTLEVPEDRRPTPKFATAPVAITAGADIPAVAAGSTLPDMRAVADAMVQRMRGMSRTSGGDGEQHTVATLVASFPEDRVLRSNEPDRNNDKIDKVISPAAITAAGGICAPVNVRYELFGLGTADRPVRDSLPSFNADRGGIRFVTPPVFGDLAGAASLWTLQDDIDAATVGAPDPVKPCIRVACGAEVTVYTDAIPLCLTFGNMGARAYPELVARHNELGLMEHSRFSEVRLLTRIGTLSTAVSAARDLGAARDFLSQVDRASTAYRGRHRMGANAPLRVIAPWWLLDLLRSDLVNQLPGDNMDHFAVADSQINAWLRARNVNITWSFEGETGQTFGAQAAGALNNFPTTVIWYMFAEGTFLFLDGGTLDIGLVRDSSLNGTNDYKMFLETFEGVAKVGIESLRITSTLKADGASRGTVAPGSVGP